jgi:hypothetical protein
MRITKTQLRKLIMETMTSEGSWNPSKGYEYGDGPRSGDAYMRRISGKRSPMSAPEQVSLQPDEYAEMLTGDTGYNEAGIASEVAEKYGLDYEIALQIVNSVRSDISDFLGEQ